MDKLIVLVEDPTTWSPYLLAELFSTTGEWLWDAVALTEDDLIAELTRRNGRADMLACLYPRGFRLDVRYPLPASA